MQLNLIRTTFTKESTIGKLSIDGVFEAYTLERAWDGNNTPNISPIPEGTYPVTLIHSHRFGRDVLSVQKVPGRTDIEIHIANVASQLLGCIAVGQTCAPNFIGNSEKALVAILAKFRSPATLTIESIEKEVIHDPIS